jgi:hypothetical protein
LTHWKLAAAKKPIGRRPGSTSPIGLASAIFSASQII